MNYKPFEDVRDLNFTRVPALFIRVGTDILYIHRELYSPQEFWGRPGRCGPISLPGHENFGGTISGLTTIVRSDEC